MTDDAPLYRHHYRAIVVDNPWRFKAHTPEGTARSTPYKTMTLPEIKALPIRELANPEGCFVFMWTTGPFLELSFEVFRSWGVKYSSVAFYYLKMRRKFNDGQIELVTTDIIDLEKLFHVGRGYTTRKNIEPCLLGRIGKPRRQAKDVRELIIDPLREHSRKPDQTLDRVERFCEGPYLELFSRSSRDNWTHWGDQAGQFDKKKSVVS